MLGESWGGTSHSAGRRGPMSFESLAMSVCVASLGLFIETRWAPSLVLETPLTACLLPKRDPFVFFPPWCAICSKLLHSYMVMVVLFVCLFHLWKIWETQESILKNHPFSYHPWTSTVIILVFPSKKKILKKRLMWNNIRGLWKLKMGCLKYQKSNNK